MTTMPAMQCLTCEHFRSPLDYDDPSFPEQTCDAYPKGIPVEIWTMQADHREPFAGDGGVRWASRDSAKFPGAMFE